MVRFHVQLWLSNDPVRAQGRVNIKSGWIRNARYWLESSRIEAMEEGLAARSAEYESRPEQSFTSAMAHFVRGFCAIALASNDAPLPMIVGDLVQALSDRARNPARDSYAKRYFIQMFPVLWRSGLGFLSTQHREGYSEVNSANIMFSYLWNPPRLVPRKCEPQKFLVAVSMWLNGECCSAADIERIKIDLDRAYSDSSPSRKSRFISPPKTRRLEDARFIGRSWALEMIEESLAELEKTSPNAAGFIWLVGPRGAGKSALCARYARTRQLPFVSLQHSRPACTNLSRLLYQELRRHLGNPTLPAPDNSQNYIELLFNAASKIRPRRSIVVVIDAIDVRSDRKKYPFPITLPPGIVVLASLQSTESRLAKSMRNSKLLSISPDDPRNVIDIEHYITDRVGSLDMKELSRNNRSAQVLIDRLKYISGGVIGVVAYLVDELNSTGSSCEYEKIPVGLKLYYEHYLTSVHRSSGVVWFTVRLPVLVVLLETRRPCTLEFISRFASQARSLNIAQVESALAGFRPLLLERLDESGEEKDVRYEILPSLRCYLEADWQPIAEEKKILAEVASAMRVTALMDFMLYSD